MGATEGAKFRAVVTDIREERKVEGRSRWQLQLDRTEFAEGEAGVLQAVARSGAMLQVRVLAVMVDGNGEVWHVVEKPLATGTEITGWVDHAKL